MNLPFSEYGAARARNRVSRTELWWCFTRPNVPFISTASHGEHTFTYLADKFNTGFDHLLNVYSHDVRWGVIGVKAVHEFQRPGYWQDTFGLSCFLRPFACHMSPYLLLKVTSMSILTSSLFLSWQCVRTHEKIQEQTLDLWFFYGSETAEIPCLLRYSQCAQDYAQRVDRSKGVAHRVVYLDKLRASVFSCLSLRRCLARSSIAMLRRSGGLSCLLQCDLQSKKAVCSDGYCSYWTYTASAWYYR